MVDESVDRALWAQALDSRRMVPARHPDRVSARRDRPRSAADVVLPHPLAAVDAYDGVDFHRIDRSIRPARDVHC
jgi:hypothetical protein